MSSPLQYIPKNHPMSTNCAPTLFSNQVNSDNHQPRPKSASLPRRKIFSKEEHTSHISLKREHFMEAPQKKRTLMESLPRSSLIQLPFAAATAATKNLFFKKKTMSRRPTLWPRADKFAAPKPWPAASGQIQAFPAVFGHCRRG